MGKVIKRKPDAIKAVSIRGLELQNVSGHLQKDEEVVYTAVLRSPDAIQYAHKSFLKDKDFARRIFEAGAGPAIKYFDDSIRNNKDFIDLAIKYNPRSIFRVPKEYFQNKEYALNAAKAGINIVTKGGYWSNDFDIVNEVLKHDVSAIIECSDELRKNKEIGITIVSRHGESLRHLDPILRNDREVVAAAINNDAVSIKWASEALRKDYELADEAVRLNGKAYCFIDESLKKDKWLMISACKDENCMIFKILPPEARDDYAVAYAAIITAGDMYQYAGPNMKKEDIFIAATIANNGNNIQYVPIDMACDETIVLKRNIDLNKPVPAWKHKSYITYALEHGMSFSGLSEEYKKDVRITRRLLDYELSKIEPKNGEIFIENKKLIHELGHMHPIYFTEKYGDVIYDAMHNKNVNVESIYKAMPRLYYAYKMGEAFKTKVPYDLEKDMAQREKRAQKEAKKAKGFFTRKPKGKTQEKERRLI